MNKEAFNRFDQITYLASGTPQQRKAYDLLTKHQIMPILRRYDAVLVGTIPLDIAIPSSDLDVLCSVADFTAFQAYVQTQMGHHPDFKITHAYVRGVESVFVNFRVENFAVEVFAQHMPVKRQHGFLHLIKEYEILTRCGQDFKQKIIDLKRAGIKTEPAFAQLLQISGDPYEGLLKYEVHENF
ncbi:DUF4269 domain-containing protein [Sphingobacterium suaedae]|uniref:DUF4269 domain-containing protein n=1 Tax=Sphingobacterium suaedae TaxID=1686402 RepID=A0ABW5KE27_9SPHI